ncbi:MAG TPA: P63C domain-containing protein [Thermoanaerobaculia bacterium]|nr:P63C domain-containing protein [Thermoanaerobaculia bacterium]
MNDQKKNPHAAELGRLGASKGGRARAEKLSDERRSEISRLAAEARWKKEGSLKPRATHSGVVTLGDVEIHCYVLESGERILSTRGVMKGLGRRWRGRKYPGTDLPVFLEANSLQPFISKDLRAVLNPVRFRTETGSEAEGLLAECLPEVCEVYLRARDAGALTKTQVPVAKQCEILMRGLSRLGIIALVDEATGYQEVRDRQALQIILDKYLTDEWAKWTRTFPDEFYRELFRLKGLEYPRLGKQKPQYVGHWTNSIIYDRLAPGVRKELQRRNPRGESGHRPRKHHQHLTPDYGHPALRELLSNSIFLMRACDDFEEFEYRLNRVAPKYGNTIPLEMNIDKKRKN